MKWGMQDFNYVVVAMHLYDLYRNPDYMMSKSVRQWDHWNCSLRRNFTMWCFIREVDTVVDLAFNMYLHKANSCEFRFSCTAFHVWKAFQKNTSAATSCVKGRRASISLHSKSPFCFPDCQLPLPDLSYCLTLVSQPRIPPYNTSFENLRDTRCYHRNGRQNSTIHVAVRLDDNIVC